MNDTGSNRWLGEGEMTGIMLDVVLPVSASADCAHAKPKL